MSYYRIGEFNVIPGMEEEFEDLVQQFFIETRGSEDERLQVQLIRSISDPHHYRIVSLWASDTRWDTFGQSAPRRMFSERLRDVTFDPAGGEWFEVLIHES